MTEAQKVLERPTAKVTHDCNNIPLFGRDGKYIAGINTDQACDLEDRGKVKIVNGEAHQI
jgi:predicted membrane GTPase involved in stress response